MTKPNFQMNAELKKVVGRVKTAQAQLQSLLKDKTWIEEARKYAERQGKEVKKLLSGDVARVKTFLERERKELERFQKQIPSEVQKFRKFVDGQRKEFERLLKNVRRAGATAGSTRTHKTNGSNKGGSSSRKKGPSSKKGSESSTSANA